MTSIRMTVIASLALAAGHFCVGPRDAGAVACPEGGVTIDVCVDNPTASTRQLRISGQLVTGENTCHSPGLLLEYSQYVDVPAEGDCFSVTGLCPGMWRHRIADEGPGGLKMIQNRKAPVLFGGGAEPRTTLYWTYFPSAIYVTEGGDGTATPSNCPINAADAVGLRMYPAGKTIDAHEEGGYSLIPLESGKFRSALGVKGMDSAGRLFAIGGDPASEEVKLVKLDTARVERVQIPLASSPNGFHVSGDGRRLVFRGGGVPPSSPLQPFRLGILDLTTGQITQGPTDGSQFLSTDFAGRRVAFWTLVRAPEGNTRQYFLYDFETEELRQITDDPEGAVESAGSRTCPRSVGTTPVISADGTTIAFASRARLGLAPEEGCHVFAYDVPSDTLRHVVRIPSGDFDLPAISGDGRWLSFVHSRFVPPSAFRSVGALVDLHTGEIIDPVGGITEHPTFDAVVTADGRSVVLWTQADLDPRAGNSDHNMEFFLYDLSSGEFTQITDTTGGIGRLAGGCPPRQPAVSADGGAVLFSFSRASGGTCQLDGPQRTRVHGFVFRRAAAVRRRPGNRPPALAPAGNARVLTGETVELDLAASDPDGDAIFFFAQLHGGTDIPPGSDIVDHHNGTASFRWPTTTEDAGAYVLRVAAFDSGGGDAFEDVILGVCTDFVADGDLPGVLRALFEPEPAAPCRDADLNGDGVVSAADVVMAAAEGVM